jgi:hypothetical protein
VFARPATAWNARQCDLHFKSSYFYALNKQIFARM